MAQGFKFSDPDPAQQAEQAAQAAREDRIAYELSTPCRADLKGKKIMLIIGEQQSNGYVSAQQQNYGPHYQAINGRLRSLGLRTYHAGGDPRARSSRPRSTPISRTIPTARCRPQKRLGASFILRGLISSRGHAQPDHPRSTRSP